MPKRPARESIYPSTDYCAADRLSSSDRSRRKRPVLGRGRATIVPAIAIAGNPVDSDCRFAATGNPPMALKGYCPVELCRNGRWVQGDPRWTVDSPRGYLSAFGQRAAAAVPRPSRTIRAGQRGERSGDFGHRTAERARRFELLRRLQRPDLHVQQLRHASGIPEESGTIFGRK